jgi:Na+/proline symporter
MEFLQLIVALFYAPVFAAVLAGVLSKRTNERGAFAGIILGVLSACSLQASFWMGYLHFGSQMNSNFYAAILSFSVAMLGCMSYRRQNNGTREIARHGSVPSSTVPGAIRLTPALAVLSAALLTLCLFLNMLWW